MKTWVLKKLKQLISLPWKKIALAGTFIILGIVLINNILNWVPTRDFLTILPVLKLAIFSLFVVGIVIFSFRKEFKIENHQGIINSLLIIITIIFTFSVYFIDKQNTFYNTNTDLVRVNEINKEIADAIMNKAYDKGYPWIFFLTEPYERNITFISKNFTSSDCVTNYYQAMMEMRILNDVHKSVVMHVVEESSISDLIYNKASSTSNLIKKILKECHPSNSSNLN